MRSVCDYGDHSHLIRNEGKDMRFGFSVLMLFVGLTANAAEATGGTATANDMGIRAVCRVRST